MIKCQNCYNFLYCENRSFTKEYCEGYRQKHCDSCAKYPFCKECTSINGTCNNYLTKMEIRRYYD